MEFGGIGVKGQFPGEPQPFHLHLAHSHPQRCSRPALGGQLEIVPGGLVRRAKPGSLRFLNGVLNLHAPALPSWKRLISPSSSSHLPGQDHSSNPNTCSLKVSEQIPRKTRSLPNVTRPPTYKGAGTESRPPDRPPYPTPACL